MKHFDREAYIQLLKLWDAKHHLLGRSDPYRLYKESVEALKTLPPTHRAGPVIDLGAGNGILGIPALLEGYCSRVLLLEPMPKRVAFLEAVRAEMRRLGDARFENLRIVPFPVQSVSRETLEKALGPEWPSTPVLTRAFSGSLGLREALDASLLKESPVWKFFVAEDKKRKKFVLKPLEIEWDDS